MVDFKKEIKKGTREIRLYKYDEVEREAVVTNIYEVPVKVLHVTIDVMDESIVDELSVALYDDVCDILDREGYVKIEVSSNNNVSSFVLKEDSMRVDLIEGLRRSCEHKKVR